MKYSVIRIGYVLALMVAVVYAFFTMRGPHGISAWMEKRQEIRELEERNAALARENQVRREYIERLEKSPGVQSATAGLPMPLSGSEQLKSSFWIPTADASRVLS